MTSAILGSPACVALVHLCGQQAEVRSEFVGAGQGHGKVSVGSMAW